MSFEELVRIEAITSDQNYNMSFLRNDFRKFSRTQTRILFDSIEVKFFKACPIEYFENRNHICQKCPENSHRSKNAPSFSPSGPVG